MALKRPEICQLIDFPSWTAVQVWIVYVVEPAHQELANDYLLPFKERGEKSPGGDAEVKDHLIQSCNDLMERVNRRFAGLLLGYQAPRPNKEGWGLTQHYEQFIVEALAYDRFAALGGVHRVIQHIAHIEYAAHPPTLIAKMYELTDAICHNFWKTGETEFWDSDDSDVPYTDGADVPTDPDW